MLMSAGDVGRPSSQPGGAGGVDEPGVEISPQIAVRAWEMAYRSYGEALAAWERSPHDESVGWAMASTSYTVAAAWRQIAGVSRLPLWMVAAVDAAALRFDAQAQEWEAHHPSAPTSRRDRWGERSW
jgi:hypothetical protein